LFVKPIIGLYDADNRLVALDKYTQPIAAGEIITFDFSLPATDEAVTTKAFLWDECSFAPLLGSVALKIGG